jgi:hypothetical protein
LYQAYITRIKNLRKAENSDRLQIGECFGSSVIVSLEYTDNQLGIFFPVDGQLSLEYCQINNLLRKKDSAGNQIGGFLEEDKRHIRALKLRGNVSDGLFMPLSSLETFGSTAALKEGDIVTVFNGHEIARKYIPHNNTRNKGNDDNGRRLKGKEKRNRIQYPFFVEHIDTPQLRFCMSNFKIGDIICITEKVHGTSTRNAYTLCISHRRNLFHKIFGLNGKELREYKYIVGTRRTTLTNHTEGGFYGTNTFRLNWANKINGKLNAGEEVFGEIAGFIAPNSPIMPRGDNKKTQDKEFIQKFGKTTTFSYGCNEEEGQSRFFIYRMTYTSPEGYVIEYPWDLVKIRAEQMGFETVPELDRFIYTTEEDFINRINKWMDISSTIDSTHIIEGVVVRALNAPIFRVAKEKSFNFKVIESIIKIDAIEPDREEAEEVTFEESMGE